MKWNLKYKLVLVSSIGFIITIICLIVIYQHLNKPASIRLNSSLKGSATSSSYAVDLTPINKSDNYVSFNYPRGLSLKSTALAGSTSLDDYDFYAKDIYGWYLNIDISNLPGGQLSQSSSYTYRVKNPDQYSRQDETVDSRPVVIMTDKNFTNGFSKVAYLVNGSKLATVSLIGNDSSGIGPLQTTFDMVVSSWQWH